MVKRISSKQFKNIYKRVPRLCVDLVIKNSDGILLTLRNIPPAKGYWHLPGGTVLHGESLEKAAKRVLKQELGVDIETITQLGILEYITSQTNFGHSVSVVFLVKLPVKSETYQIKLDNQASEFKFFKKIPDRTIIEQRIFLTKLK